MSTQQELKQQGNTHFQNDDFEKAIEFYTLAIEKDAFCDDAAPILSNRSLCYYNVGKYKEAYEDAGCCCGIRPDWAKGFARRGAAAEELKEWQIALESYNEYLKLSESDEMGIVVKKNRVKKFVDAIEKSKLKREQELRALEEALRELEEDLSAKDTQLSVIEAAKVKCKVYKTLNAGCQEMIIDKVELAVKHGADLGEYFMSEKGIMDESELKNKDLPKGFDRSRFRFIPPDFAMAGESAKKNPFDLGISSGAKEALNFLLRKSHRSKMSEFEQTDLLIRQRNYFDRLLDLPHKQREKYVPPPQLLKKAICEICTYDSENPIRDDLVMILLEKGNKYFVGDDVSEKEFKKIVLRCVLVGGGMLVSAKQANTKVVSEEKSLNNSNPSSESSLRKIIDCLQMCLKGLSAEDLNSECDSRILQYCPSLLKALPIISASMLHQSPLVTQLLIDRGANVNVSFQRVLPNNGGLVTHYPLLQALTSGSQSVAELLLSRGAKLLREKLPDWVHAQFEEKDAETMMVPQNSGDYSPWTRDITKFILDDANAGRDERKIRLFFDAMADQNLSVFGRHEQNGTVMFHTVLNMLILNGAPIKTLETIIKVRPKLLSTPSVGKNDHHFPMGIVFQQLRAGGISLDYAKRVLKILLDSENVLFFVSTARKVEDTVIRFHDYVSDMIKYREEEALSTERFNEVLALQEYGHAYELERINKGKKYF